MERKRKGIDSLVWREAKRIARTKARASFDDFDDSYIIRWFQYKYVTDPDGKLRTSQVYQHFCEENVDYRRTLQEFGSRLGVILKNSFNIQSIKNGFAPVWPIQRFVENLVDEEILDELEDEHDPNDNSTNDNSTNELSEESVASIQKSTNNKNASITSVKTIKTVWSSYPQLGSNEMAQLAWQLLRTDSSAPTGIRNLVETDFDISSKNIGGLEPCSRFIVATKQRELEDNGVTVIDNVFTEKEISCWSDYLKALLSANQLDDAAYMRMSGYQFTPAVVTKQGWTKMYITAVAQAVSCHPNMWTIASELYGITRIATNFAEIKASHPREPVKGDNLEFVHTDINLEKSILLHEAGYEQNALYQMIVPLTDMEFPGPTVLFSKGMHKVESWKPFVDMVAMDGRRRF